MPTQFENQSQTPESIEASLIASIDSMELLDNPPTNQLKKEIWEKITKIFKYLSLSEIMWLRNDFQRVKNILQDEISWIDSNSDVLLKIKKLWDFSRNLDTNILALKKQLNQKFNDTINNDYGKVGDKLSLYIAYIELHDWWDEFILLFKNLKVIYNGIHVKMLEDNWSDSLWKTLLSKVDAAMKLFVSWKTEEAKSLIIQLSWTDIQSLSADNEFQKDQIIAATWEVLINEQYGKDWWHWSFPNPEISWWREKISSLISNLQSMTSAEDQQRILLEYKSWLSGNVASETLDPLVFDEMIGLTKEPQLKQYFIDNKSDILESFRDLEDIYEMLAEILKELEKLPVTDYNNKSYAEILALMTVIEWLSNDPKTFFQMILHWVWYESKFDILKIDIPALVAWKLAQAISPEENDYFTAWFWAMYALQVWLLWYSLYWRYGWSNSEKSRDKQIKKIKNQKLWNEEEGKRIEKVKERFNLEKSANERLQPLIDFYTNVVWDNSMVKKLYNLTELNLRVVTINKNYPFERLFARDVLKLLSNQKWNILMRGLKMMTTLSIIDNAWNAFWSNVNLSNIDNFIIQGIPWEGNAIFQLEQITKRMQTINEVVTELKAEISQSWLNKNALETKINKAVKELLNPNFVRASLIVGELEKIHGIANVSWVNTFTKEIKDKLLVQIELALSNPRFQEVKISNEIEKLLNEKPIWWRWKFQSLWTSLNQMVWKRMVVLVDIVTQGKYNWKVTQSELIVDAIAKANTQIQETNDFLKWSMNNLRPYLKRRSGVVVDKFDVSIRSNNDKISAIIKDGSDILNSEWHEKLSGLADSSEWTQMGNIKTALKHIAHASELINARWFNVKIKEEIEKILREAYSSIDDSVKNDSVLKVDVRLNELMWKDGKWGEISKIRNPILINLLYIKDSKIQKKVIEAVIEWVITIEPNPLNDKITSVSDAIKGLRDISWNFHLLPEKLQDSIVAVIGEDTNKCTDLIEKAKVLNSVKWKVWLQPTVEKAVLDWNKTLKEIQDFKDEIIKLKWDIASHKSLQPEFDRIVQEFDIPWITTLQNSITLANDAVKHAQAKELAEIKAWWWKNTWTNTEASNWSEKVDTTNDSSPEKSEVQNKIDKLGKLRNNRKELSRLSINKAPIVSISVVDISNKRTRITFDVSAKNFSTVLRHLESVKTVSSVKKLLNLSGVSDTTTKSSVKTAKEKLILENHKQKELAVDFIERAKLELQLAGIDDANGALDKIKLEFVDKTFSDDKAVDFWQVKTLIGEYLHLEWINHIREKEELLRDFGKNIPNLSEQELYKYAKMYAEWRYDSLKETSKWINFFNKLIKAIK